MLTPVTIRTRRAIERLRNALRAGSWSPYSRLFLAGDGANWSLSHDMRELGRIARRIGLRVASTDSAVGVSRQSVFYASQSILRDDRYFSQQNRIAVSYFHGIPRADEPAFAEQFNGLRSHHRQLDRVQVTNRSFRDFVLSSGIEPRKVFLIPIGVRLDHFPLRSNDSRATARARLGLPQRATVLGSFQKDGIGWAQGNDPKLIKGPDVLLEVVAHLRERISDVFVLLSGPARGYVRVGLERLGVPYRHRYVRDHRRLVDLYHALDLYLVTSREEGGPKAMLEAMACGVPLVTTRVGQAADLVRHGQNAWMVDVDDVDGLVHHAEHALGGATEQVVHAARATAEAHAYERQDPVWEAFFDGFVARR